MNAVTQWCALTATAITLLITGALMDGPEDYSAEWGESTHLQELQASEASTERREKAAQELCRQAIGESVVLWTAEGHLVCRSRRVAKAQVQL